MTVNPQWQRRIRQVLADAQATTSTAKSKLECGFQSIEQTPDTRQLRAILRIAQRYPWGADVVLEYLDEVQAETLANLSPAQLSALHARITAYADAAQHACGSPDTPPPS